MDHFGLNFGQFLLSNFGLPGLILAISGLNLPKVPGVDFDHFGLNFGQFLLSNFGLPGWILAISGLNLPKVPGLDFDHFGLILANFCFQISPLEAGFWPYRG